MERLYVAVQGATVGCSGQRLQIRKQGAILKDVIASEVEEVFLMGHVQLTPDAVRFLLGREVDVFFLSQSGRYRGRLMGEQGRAVTLRRAQYAAVSSPLVKLAVARRLVSEKLRFQRYVICRGNRRADEGLGGAAMTIRALRDKLESGYGRTADELMGVEGAASAAYFAAYGETLTQQLGFTARNRRPPRDPVNALLSFGYTMLMGTMTSIVNIVGLDPYLGFLHADQDARQSLTLDLMEPFRPLIVDVAVRTLLNRRALVASDFQPGPENAVLLGPKGIGVLVENYQKRLENQTACGERNETTEMRRVMELYVRRLARLLREGKAGELEPVPVPH